MLAADYPEFEAQIRRLETMFGKGLEDDVVKDYWHALKDLPLEKFKSYVEKHFKRGKFFPKPAELRPKDEKSVERDAAADAAFKQGETRSARNLADLRARDPAEHDRRVRIARLDRLIATTHESDPAYQQILCEWREARGIHVGPTEWPQPHLRQHQEGA